MLKKMAALLRDEEGQGMVEYGLIIALVSVVLIGVLMTMQGSLSGVFTGASGALDTATPSSTTP